MMQQNQNDFRIKGINQHKNMKNLTLTIVFFLSIATVYGQSNKTQTLLDSIQGQYVMDDNQNLTYSRVVECPGMTKRQIFDRAQSWFIYNYNSGKDVLQVQDSTAGTMIGKGFYSKVYSGANGFWVTQCDAWHIVRVDAKNEKVRIIVTLTNWEKTLIPAKAAPTTSTESVYSQYPINPKGGSKTIMGKAFFALHNRAQATFASLEKAIKEGNTSKAIEGSNW